MEPSPRKKRGEENRCLTGVKILTVNGESVANSVFIDTIHNIRWSIVLESVLGSKKHLVLKNKKIGS